MKNGDCQRTGSMVRVSRSSSGAVQGKRWPLNGTLPGEQACTVGWCRSDRKGRSHMKSTVAWHEAPHDTVKKSTEHGVVKRVIRLAADWALLKDHETKKAVQDFAMDNDKFHITFAAAWKKVVDKTHSSLSMCTGPTPTERQIEQETLAMKCVDSVKDCWKYKGSHRCREPTWYHRCPVTCGRCTPEPDMRDDDRP